jgi:hypothetical protein
MDNRPIDFVALRESSVAKDYDRIVSKIKKLEDTIKKDFETNQDKPETYVYKRAVTSLDFNTTCLERADQALEKRKQYLRQKYEEDLLKAEQDNEKDVLKYRKGIDSANIVIEEEKKKKKSKTVIHAEYDITQLQKQLEKLKIPRVGDNIMTHNLPNKVNKVIVVESESESESEPKRIPSCPCGNCVNVGKDLPPCMLSQSDIDALNRPKQAAREQARYLREQEEKEEEKREFYRKMRAQEREREIAAERAREDDERKQELEERDQEKQREEEERRQKEEERRQEEEEWEEAQKYIAEKKAQQAAAKAAKQTPLTQFNQLPRPDSRQLKPLKPVKKVSVGKILYNPPVEVQ